jgi:hypothetical protein
MNWTTKPIYFINIADTSAHRQGCTCDECLDKITGSEPLKPTLTINEDGLLGEAGNFTVEPFDLTLEVEFKDSKLTKIRSNKVPTHDPYTNPNVHIYYSCDCGNILDPGTKRFAELNNAAMDAGWKIRWGHQYYEPFCPKCVKLKGIE